MPPSPYSYSLINEINEEPTEFSYKDEIKTYCGFACVLFPIYGFILMIATFLFFQTCVPTDRLEPCTFNGKMTFQDIYSLKKDINDTQKKIDEITNVMQYGLSVKSSKILLRKRNLLNETLESLKQEFNQQKIKFEKCYFINYRTNNDRYILFSRILSLALPCIVFYLFGKTIYYITKIPASKLSKKENQSYEDFITGIICSYGILIVLVCVYVSIIFGYRFDLEDVPEIPIFSAESWENVCSGRSRRITVDDFLESRGYKYTL